MKQPQGELFTDGGTLLARKVTPQRCLETGLSTPTLESYLISMGILLAKGRKWSMKGRVFWRRIERFGGWRHSSDRVYTEANLTVCPALLPCSVVTPLDLNKAHCPCYVSVQKILCMCAGRISTMLWAVWISQCKYDHMLHRIETIRLKLGIKCLEGLSASLNRKYDIVQRALISIRVCR